MFRWGFRSLNFLFNLFRWVCRPTDVVFICDCRPLNHSHDYKSSDALFRWVCRPTDIVFISDCRPTDIAFISDCRPMNYACRFKSCFYSKKICGNVLFKAVTFITMFLH